MRIGFLAETWGTGLLVRKIAFTLPHAGTGCNLEGHGSTTTTMENVAARRYYRVEEPEYKKPSGN